MRLLTLLFVLLLCLTANAQFLSPEWGYSFGSPNDDASYATDTDAAGNVYVGGGFTGTIDFDPGPGTTYLSTSPGVQTFFLQKFDPFGNLLWAKKLFPRSNLVYEGLRMEVDAGGNVYLSDSFKGGIDFDPGSGRFVLGTSGGNMDIFIVKLDASGNFLWVTQTGGSTHDELKSISIDPTGNIYCLGQYRNQVDFDPGPGVFNLTAQQGGASFIQKLSPSGDFLWAKSFDGIDYGGLSQIKADLDGNIFAAGVFWRTQDFDPGPNTFSLTSTNSGNIFTLKLDAAGDFQWAVQIVGTDAAYQVFFAVDPLGEIYISSTFSGTSDFDPGPGVSSLTSANGGSWQDLFLQKLDGDGNLLWVKQMSSPGLADAFIESGVLEISSAGIIYLTGDFLAHSPTGASIDFDPGPGLAEVFLVDSPVNSIVASYSPDGNLFWAKSIAGTYYRMVRDIATDQHENIYLSGSIYDTVDFDPGLDTFDLRATNQRLDFYLIKWSQDSCFGLASVIDNSINIGCSSTGYSSGHAMGGQTPYSYQWNTLPADTNNFTRFTDPGLYEFTVSDTDGCSHTSRVLISAPSNQQGGDLQVNITTTDFRTGFDAKIWLDAFNDGCIPVSGEVILVLDPFLTYKSASPLPDTLRGDTLVWKVNNISYDSPHFTAQVDVTVSTEARIGDLICLDASISSKGNDVNPKNDTRDFCRAVINSFDPNDKRVLPQGVCSEGFISNDEVLTYTIRFQNTGNADAINVFILDSLDLDLDINTVKIVGQSHKPMITEVLEDRTLKFRFDDIHLPDSNTNEPQSHGYVMYEVSPLPNLANGTEIENTAGIYFDFNEPVITNTVLNTIIEVVPAQDTAFLQAEGCNSYDLNGRTYTAPGTYTQRIARSNGCDSILVLNLSLDPLDTTITQIGTSLTANEGGAHGLNIGYQWVDCDQGNAPILGATNQNFTPSANGNYAVMLNRGDCSEMSACVHVSTVGIDPDFQSEINHYPNPTTSLLHIDLGKSYAVVEIEVFNMLGEKVMIEKKKSLDKCTIHLPEQSGMYFIRIKAEGRNAVLKLIRE